MSSSKTSNKSSKSSNKSSKSSNKSSNKSSKSSSSAIKQPNEIFNGEFVIYLLIIVIPSSFLLNKAFKNDNFTDQVQLFFLTAIITGLVLYYILRDKDKSISLLEDQHVLYFIIFIVLMMLYLSIEKMIKLNVYTLNGGAFFMVFILTILIIFNLISILTNL